VEVALSAFFVVGELEAEINQLVTTMAPELLTLPGVGSSPVPLRC
jgi:hypothetical protein